MLRRILFSLPLVIGIATGMPFAGISCDAGRPPAVIRDHDLSDDRWKDFNAIRENFIRNAFPECTARSKLKLSCAGCGYIYITVRISIDAGGRMTGYTKIKEHVCGGPAPAALERCFIEYLESVTFPRSLRSLVIETNLGNGLKC